MGEIVAKLGTGHYDWKELGLRFLLFGGRRVWWFEFGNFNPIHHVKSEQVSKRN